MILDSVSLSRVFLESVGLKEKKNIRCNGNILNCFRSLLLLSYYLHICIMQISMPLFSTVATEEYQLEKRLYASATWH